MRSNLPPLNAVRAFEAAARHLSFNRAAEELHVTPSAISHQISSLEAFLKLQLFHRKTRQVELTSEGQRYLSPLREALDMINTATEQLLSKTQATPLTMSTVPAFTSRWLLPRLPAFQIAHPEIEVRLITTVEMVDFSRSDVDLAIRRGSGTWPGLESHYLMTVKLVPVCSPALIEKKPLRRPEDLRDHTLLHVLPVFGEWRAWLDAAGVTDIDAEQGPKFLDYLLALEAAVAGLGVAILDKHVVTDDLERGRLLIPFDVETITESAYYLVYPQACAGSTKIAAFRDWLLAEVSSQDQ